jgi:hypothetical protein
MRRQREFPGWGRLSACPDQFLNLESDPSQIDVEALQYARTDSLTLLHKAD